MTTLAASPDSSIGSRWQPYQEYKASDVAWLERIPSHWSLRRLKFVARLSYGDSLATDSRTAGDVPVFGSNGAVGSHDVANTLAPCIIVGRKGSYGKVNYSNVPVFAIDTTYFIDSRTTKADMRWLFYSLPLLGLETSSQDTGVPGLSRDFAYEQWILFPPLLEQRAIAAFLDRETARIDALLAKRERLVTLLEEKRTALISHAVTRGLDPSLPLKDSGVVWLGAIPAHWDILHLRRVVQQFVDYRDTVLNVKQLRHRIWVGHNRDRRSAAS